RGPTSRHRRDRRRDSRGRSRRRGRALEPSRPRNLTPQPPSLRGKGEKTTPPSLSGKGAGGLGLENSLLQLLIQKLDRLLRRLGTGHVIPTVPLAGHFHELDRDADLLQLRRQLPRLLDRHGQVLRTVKDQERRGGFGNILDRRRLLVCRRVVVELCTDE